jgi:ribosomal protein S18 acetylase RimI-like enzyme
MPNLEGGALQRRTAAGRQEAPEATAASWFVRSIQVQQPSTLVAMPTGTLRFRTAGPSDVDAVVQLVESAYRGEASRAGWTTEADLLGGQRTDPEEVLGLTRDRHARLLLAEQTDELVGCVLVRAEPAAVGAAAPPGGRAAQTGVAPSGVAQIGMFAVRPTLQSRGLGSALLAEAERVARAELGAGRAEMTVIEQRLDLLPWYERRGYRRTSATEPFPYGNPRFGLPRRPDLRFLVLAKPLTA